MMEDLERQHGQTWRIMFTCTTQFRGGPRHGKAYKRYKGDEGKNQGRLLIIDVGVYLDLEFYVTFHYFFGYLAKIASVV